MKYLIVVGDGMSDEPVAALGGRTPLAAACTPHLDRMVRAGVGGAARLTPEGFEPGSDVANLGLLGCDVREGYTGRSPLEAAAMGVALGPGDVAFRCNLVSLAGEGTVMGDFSAGHIGSAEAAEIVADLDRRLGGDGIRFHAGVGYRHLMVWAGGSDAVRCVPPHDIMGRALAPHLPTGPGAERLRGLMEAARAILADHPVNRRRRARGEAAADGIWLWGQGRRPRLAPLAERFGVTGAMISAVDLLKGIALHLGMEVVEVPGATGWIDTDYEGKAAAAMAALDRHDLVCVHLEAPDEAGHAGRADLKVQAIEDLDRRLLGPLLAHLEARGGPWRALALPDHPTPVRLRTHAAGPVPFAACGEGIAPDGNTRYDEDLLAHPGRVFDPGHGLLPWFLGRG
ncbi:cofactor-independent phosphoglycerate mutase [Inmirania thermothiophila]|uniref:Phosphoglycerate mutase n=1 Tax=Inmirania thermothiophila TaxID=1750597 RepID=A0A3N1Y1X3_9GAMM|nr:cofactor-independent phosphoglycerate mutase [Inmirania thermothiophila]ROR32825.1 phosphoglycerate mutase [Inmirania thermothiophila]